VPGVTWLVDFRLIAGVGAVMLVSATRVLAIESLPEGSAGKAQGFMTMSFHGGVLLGPPIGGLVIELVSWRGLFFLLVPIGIVGIVLTALTARQHHPDTIARRLAIDYVDATLLLVLTVVLTLLLESIGNANGLFHRLRAPTPCPPPIPGEPTAGVCPGLPAPRGATPSRAHTPAASNRQA
jgi:MFS family permease